MKHSSRTTAFVLFAATICICTTSNAFSLHHAIKPTTTRSSSSAVTRQSALKRTLRLAGSKHENPEADTDTKTPQFQDSPSLASAAMIGLPLLSSIFPFLLQTARSLPANSSEQLFVVTALFVGNRAYLYAMAATIVALAATRGANDAVGLGKRVTDLTEELLYRPDLEAKATDTESSEATTASALEIAQEQETPKMIQSMRQSGLEESLDEVSSETQALILPLLVSFLLASSIFFLPFWNKSPDATSVFSTPNSIDALLQKYLPTVTQIWNTGLLAVFSRSELRRLGSEFRFNSPAALEWGLAAGITAVASFTPLWPAQNFVNMALAILVSRLIQLDRFPAIVGALSLLTLYDVTSVFLIPAAGAVETAVSTSASHPSLVGGTAILVSAAGDSAMGSVAVQKLISGTFQPGLLVTKIDSNNLGGALGLGDAVFPSILATFVRRFDRSQNEDGNRPSLFAISLGGYLLGCTACEFAPILSTTGLPALVFIIPFMLGSVLAVAAVSGELEQLWNYNPNPTSPAR